MDGETKVTLEAALEQLENQLDRAVKAGAAVISELKKAKGSARTGQLRELNKRLAEARNAVGRFAEETIGADKAWTFDTEPYFESGGFIKELLDEAGKAGLTLFERDGRIYCFPMLLSLSPKEMAVLVDRKPERRVRPRELVKLLAARQKQPQRFNEQKLLETLYDAYGHLAVRASTDWTAQSTGPGPVVALADIYELLTLLPGS